MSSKSKIKPILRQFMVSAGVSLSMMEHSLVIGFTAILLPQLREDPVIRIEDSMASWIASIIGFSNIVGLLFAPTIIYKFGRRMSNLVSAIVMTVGWLCLVLANNANTIFIARFIQGVGLGFSSLSGAILVAEYTTPKYRGAFLTMIIVALLSGGLLVHMIGSFLPWHKTGIVCLCIASIDCVLVSLSPETPVFLAIRGRYDECRKVFHWLRGFDEENELETMIKTEMFNQTNRDLKMRNRSSCEKITKKIKRVFVVLIKPEFYKPLILMFHLFLCNAWSGSMLMDAFGVDIFHALQGKDVNTFAMLFSMDICRLVSTLTAVVLNTKYKRRSMLLIFFPLNILVFFLTAGYAYAKEKQALPFDHPMMGACLVYALMIIIGGGTIPLVNIVSGEVFTLKYKTVSMLITTMFMCLNIAIMMKTLPYMLSTMGISGSYCIYGLILTYGTLVGIILLPETKDRTLQEIEEEYWLKHSTEAPLMTDSHNVERDNEMESKE